MDRKQKIKIGDIELQEEESEISEPCIKGVDYFAYCHYWESDITKIADWQIEKCHCDCLAGEECPYGEDCYEEVEVHFY